MSVPVVAELREAAGNLRAAGQRTLLALIGIVVGIGAVIALLTTGSIAQTEAIDQFRALGTDMLSVVDVTPRNNSAARRNVLESSDAAGLAGLGTISAASPYTLDAVDFVLGGQRRLSVRRMGVTAAFAGMHDIRLAMGRFITPFDGRRPFAVLGAGVAQALQEAGVRPEIGMRVQIDQSIYVVAGVLASTNAGPLGVRLDDSVLVPIGRAERELATKEVQRITLRSVPGVHYLTATAEVKEHFALTSPGMNIRVDSPVPIIEQMEAQMRLFALLLGAVGGISLVVGGFGVMNAMVASVTERRLEIGIRRALGARRNDIQRQFLAESVVLCLVGGVLGALLGVGASVVISLVAGWSWQWSPSAIALGVGTACAVGMFFGFHPARQAARLDPIAAMRDR